MRTIESYQHVEVVTKLNQLTGIELGFDPEDAFHDVLLEHIQFHAERAIDGPEFDVSIIDLIEPENTIKSVMEDRTPGIHSDAVYLDGSVVDLHGGLLHGGAQN